jgi:hypothetical protein
MTVTTDKRKAVRRAIRYTAWVLREGDNEPTGCVVADVSTTGARLRFETTDAIPDDFTLLLSPRGVPKRSCHVVWRTPTEIGAVFPLPPEAKKDVPAPRASFRMDSGPVQASANSAAVPADTTEPADAN